MKLRTELMLMVLLIFVMTGCGNTSPTSNTPESVSFSESEEQTDDTETLPVTDEQEVDTESETSQDTELNGTNGHTSESNSETSGQKRILRFWKTLLISQIPLLPKFLRQNPLKRKKRLYSPML